MDNDLKELIHEYLDSHEYDSAYYMRQAENINEIGKEATEKELSLWQYILIVSSGIDGIILSLLQEPQLNLCIRLVFFLSVLSLTLGMVCSAIVVYDTSMLTRRLFAKSLAEYNKSLKSLSEVVPVFVEKRKRTSVFQILSCWCFALFVILYLIYSFFRLFPELI